jgi:anti-sigma factor RsiW
MNCAAFEVLLADYIDGALAAGQRDAFAHHLETCPACAVLAEDVRAATAFMARAWEVEPPSGLTANILHATIAGREPKLHGRGLSGWINRTFAPVLQPRIVLGVVMALLSLALIGPFGNTRGNAASLDPARVWTSIDNGTNRIWDRAVKNYESTRLIYEVKEQVDDWTAQQQEADERK